MLEFGKGETARGNNHAVHKHHLAAEQVRATPVLLNVQVAGGLPVIVLEREQNALGPSGAHDGFDGGLLVAEARDGQTVRETGARPARLQVVRLLLAVAGIGQVLQLRGDELAGLGREDGRVEEGVDVGGDDVDSWADRLGVLLDGAQGLGGGDGASVTGGREARPGVFEAAGELRSRAVAVEDGFVSEHDHLDHLPLAHAPVDQIAHLLVGVRANARAINVDAQDHLESIFGAGVADVDRAVTVSGVETHGGEALGSNRGDVGRDGGAVLARAIGGVRSVGHGPLVTVGGDGARVAA